MKHIQVNEDLFERLKETSKSFGVGVDEFVERILTKEIGDINEKAVLGMYRDRKISLQKAAEILSCSVWDMIEKVKEADISIDYTREELLEDVR